MLLSSAGLSLGWLAVARGSSGGHRNFYRIALQNLGRPPDSQFEAATYTPWRTRIWRYFLSEAWRPHEDKDFDNRSFVTFDMLGSS